MKYIDAEKLRAEIERLHEEHTTREYRDEVALVLEDLVDYIDSLQQEQPEVNLEKEYKEWWENKVSGNVNIQHTMEWYMHETARHFYELGKTKQKEQMLKDAEECELYWDEDFLAIDLNMRALGYSERDKVKVIVLKAEEG